MEIENWNFESNHATRGNGGALILECPDFDYCQFHVYDNTFTFNTAIISGGAIKWNDIQPYNLTLNTYHENYAVYGNDIASFPIKLEIINIPRKLHSNLNFISNIASG